MKVLKYITRPYIGPRPFQPEDSEIFFGRRAEERSLLAFVISHRFTVFSAPSGAGKTSLINTKLRPGLESRGFHLLPTARIGGTVPHEIGKVGNVFTFNLLLSLEQSEAIPANLKQESIDRYLRRHYLKESEWAGARVLIIDQFEELLTTNQDRWEDRRDFLIQMDNAFVGDQRLWLVLIIREDYLAALKTYSSVVTDGFRNQFQMQRMKTVAAKEAIEEPAKMGGRPFAEGVADRLVDNLREVRNLGGTYLGEFIEPVQLQVVCFQLWEQLENMPLGTITQTDIDQFGDVDTALARYYEAALAATLRQSAVSERELRNWFDQELITQDQTRGTVYRGPEATGGLDNELVKILADRYLLRSEIRAGGTYYELVHDRLIFPILQSNEEWRDKQGPVLEAAEKWEESGRSPQFFYEGNQLDDALSATSTTSQLQLVQVFLSASQEAQQERRRQQEQKLAKAREEAARFRNLALVFGLLVAALVAVGIYAAIATSARRTSESEATTAVANLAIANATANVANMLVADANATVSAANASASNAIATANSAAATAAVDPFAQATAEYAATKAAEAQEFASGAIDNADALATDVAGQVTPTPTPPDMRVVASRPNESELSAVGSIWSLTSKGYIDMQEPGIQLYDLDVRSTDVWRWTFAWCAADQLLLDDILAPLTVDFLVDGNLLSGEQIREHEGSTLPGWQCNNWSTILSHWAPGERVELEVRYELAASIFDGEASYSPGEYHHLLSVRVDQ